MTALQQALIDMALAIANDNRYVYYNRALGQSNLGPYTYDCATFNSFTIYCAMGWSNFPDSSHGSIGYFWPHISQSGYDAFLLYNNWQKYAYDASLLTEGAIIITDESLGHSLMYMGNNQLCDANNYFGYGADSIAVRPLSTYNNNTFAYIYIPPDVTPTPTPPTPGGGGAVALWKPRRKRRRYF